jgi:hypothetical protein
VPPVAWACDRAALPSESNPIRPNIQNLFIGHLLVVAILKNLDRWSCGLSASESDAPGLAN